MTTENANPDITPSDADEIVYFEGSPSLRGSLGSIVLSTVLGVLVIAGTVFLHSYGAWIPLTGILVAIAMVAIPILLTRSIAFRITNYRIDFERGLLSKDIDTLELWHVEDIKFHQSVLDRVLRIGTITVISRDDTTPSLAMRAIPDPRPVFENLKQRIITVKRQRGVIKLDPG